LVLKLAVLQKMPQNASLKATFASVDKVGERYVFNIGGNKYRLVAAIAFQAGLMWVKAALTHSDYDKGVWK
jgi:mRNA interferase HigB